MLTLKKCGHHPDIRFTGLNDKEAGPAGPGDFDETADQVLPVDRVLQDPVIFITSKTGCSMLSMTEA